MPDDPIVRAPAPMACCSQPCQTDLVLMLEGILFRLALKGCRDAGWPSPGPRPMAVERAIRIGAPVQGYLVLRCDQDLERFLWPSAQGSLAAHLVEKLARQCRESGGQAWDWSLAGGDTAHWPQREPDQARVMMIGSSALEIRFWSLFWNRAPDRGTV